MYMRYPFVTHEDGMYFRDTRGVKYMRQKASDSRVVYGKVVQSLHMRLHTPSFKSSLIFVCPVSAQYISKSCIEGCASRLLCASFQGVKQGLTLLTLP